MRRLLKGIIFVIGLLAIPAAINHWIFKRAKKETAAYYKSYSYKWRHGKIHYTVAGKGKPLLLLHDTTLGGNMQDWKRNIAALSKRYRVYVPDLLGFGHSDKPDTTYSAYLYVTLINDFINDVIGEKTNVAAQGFSAAYAVMAYDFEPSMHNKMMLIAPCGVGSRRQMPTSGSVWLRWLLRSPIIGTSIYNLAVSRCYLKWTMHNHGFADTTLVKRFLTERYDAAHRGGAAAKLPFAAFVSHFLNVNIEHVLARTAIPIHVIWGKDDPVNPVENAHVFTVHCPRATLTIFDKSKRFPHGEHPQQFDKICESFFG